MTTGIDCTLGDPASEELFQERLREWRKKRQIFEKQLFDFNHISLAVDNKWNVFFERPRDYVFAPLETGAPKEDVVWLDQRVDDLSKYPLFVSRSF
jgi:hypothetical protein